MMKNRYTELVRKFRLYILQVKRHSLDLMEGDIPVSEYKKYLVIMRDAHGEMLMKIKQKDEDDVSALTDTLQPFPQKHNFLHSRSMGILKPTHAHAHIIRRSFLHKIP